jgi:hypothetical protein
MYKFQKLLNDSNTDVKKLPEDIQNSIAAVKDLKLELEDLNDSDADPADVRETQIEIRKLDDQIVAAIEDFFDDEIDFPETEDEQRHNMAQTILSNQYGKHEDNKLSLEKLNQLGYPKEGRGPYIPDTGAYRLIKPTGFKKLYTIVKKK